MTGNQQKNDNQKNQNSIKSFMSSAKDAKCPICLTTITNRALTDSCSHEFCLDCISEWSSNHNRCPICRQIYTNIRFNIVSNESFDLLPVEEQPEIDESEIEAIVNRMLLYLRLIGLRNRVQRQRERICQDLTNLEKRVNECECSRKEKKDLRKDIHDMRSDIRQLDEEINRFNQTLSADTPTEEALLEALNGRENEVQDIEVIDIIFDQILPNDDQEIREDDSFDSVPSLVSEDDSGNVSDDEQEPEEELDNTLNTRKRKTSNNSNTDSDDSKQSSSKRKKRQ